MIGYCGDSGEECDVSAVRIGVNDTCWGGPMARAAGLPSDAFSTARILDEAALAGYRGIELSPGMLCETDEVGSLGAAVARRGLAVSGAVIGGHLEDLAGWPDLERQTRRAAEALTMSGATDIVLIDMPHLEGNPSTLSDREWANLVATTHWLGELTASFGMVLAFHPHADSHVETLAQIGRLLADTDPALVAICLDTGHLAFNGIDPADFLRQHWQRVSCLHLKNIRHDIWDRHRRSRMPWLTAVRMGVSMDLGTGIVDFQAIRDAIAEVGFHGWAIVETEREPSKGDAPFSGVRMARDLLRDIGIG